MKIYTIDAGNFMLDGGAMFGVVPKVIWQKLYPESFDNLCNWKMRCLLIEIEDKLILIDTGMGEKQPEKWQSYYYRSGTNLKSSIIQAGFEVADITDVILSHLHFDHCGGAIENDNTGIGYQLTFPNARYWTHSGQWNSAIYPNIKEKATFLSENIIPIKELNALNFIDEKPNFFGENIEFYFCDGHTEKMILPIINYYDQRVVFSSDCVPSVAHVHLPYVMAYDINPLQTINEKRKLLQEIVDNDWIIVFDHDIYIEAAKLKKTEKGFEIAQKGSLKELLNHEK